MEDVQEHFSWRLRPASLLPVDDVELALSLDSAELTYGPYLFAFVKTPLPGDGTLLSLAHIGRVNAGSGQVTRGGPALEGCARDEIVPLAHEGLDPGTREKLEARYLRVLGQALFDDVARAVERVHRPAGTPGSADVEAGTAPDHEA